MPQTLERAVLDDELAMSVARAVAAANDRARREGIEVQQSLVTVAEQNEAGRTCWRISYGPRDYLRRRGGDLIIEVGVEDAQVRRVLRGQ